MPREGRLAAPMHAPQTPTPPPQPRCAAGAHGNTPTPPCPTRGRPAAAAERCAHPARPNTATVRGCKTPCPGLLARCRVADLLGVRARCQRTPLVPTCVGSGGWACRQPPPACPRLLQHGAGSSRHATPSPQGQHHEIRCPRHARRSAALADGAARSSCPWPPLPPPGAPYAPETRPAANALRTLMARRQRCVDGLALLRIHPTPPCCLAAPSRSAQSSRRKGWAAALPGRAPGVDGPRITPGPRTPVPTAALLRGWAKRRPPASAAAV